MKLVILLLFISLGFTQDYSTRDNNYSNSSVVKWVKARELPDNAILFDATGSSDKFVARAYYKGQYYIGEKNVNQNYCLIYYKGIEVKLKEFQYLVYYSNSDEKGQYKKKIYKIIDVIYSVLNKQSIKLFLDKSGLNKVKANLKEIREKSLLNRRSDLVKYIDELLPKIKGSLVNVKELKNKIINLERKI